MVPEHLQARTSQIMDLICLSEGAGDAADAEPVAGREEGAVDADAQQRGFGVPDVAGLGRADEAGPDRGGDEPGDVRPRDPDADENEYQCARSLSI